MVQDLQGYHASDARVQVEIPAQSDLQYPQILIYMVDFGKQIEEEDDVCSGKEDGILHLWMQLLSRRLIRLSCLMNRRHTMSWHEQKSQTVESRYICNIQNTHLCQSMQILMRMFISIHFHTRTCTQVHSHFHHGTIHGFYITIQNTIYIYVILYTYTVYNNIYIY